MNQKRSQNIQSSNSFSIIFYSALIGLLWLVLSGHYTPLLLSFGFLSCAFVILLTVRGKFFNGDFKFEHLLVKIPVYWFWLSGEIIKSNFATAKAIWFNKYDPEIFEVQTSQKNENGLANYANSITLTPGTVTVLIEKNMFLIHALTPEMGEDVRSGIMDKKVAELDS